MKIYSNDQYFEAIFQLRPHNKEVEDYIRNQVKKKDKVFISKEIDKKFGIDFYLTSQKFDIPPYGGIMILAHKDGYSSL